MDIKAFVAQLEPDGDRTVCDCGVSSTSEHLATTALLVLLLSKIHRFKFDDGASDRVVDQIRCYFTDEYENGGL